MPHPPADYEVWGSVVKPFNSVAVLASKSRGHSLSREPVAVPRVESMGRIHEFFKGNQGSRGLCPQKLKQNVKIL